MKNTLQSEIEDLLYFQSSPGSSNMLTDEQVKGAAHSILSAIKKRVPEKMKDLSPAHLNISGKKYATGYKAGHSAAIDDFINILEGRDE